MGFALVRVMTRLFLTAVFLFPVTAGAQPPADADPADVSKVQHKLENARVKLAKAGTPGKQ